VFQLHHIENVQQFANVIRTVALIPNISTDAAQKTMTVSGTASQIAIAEWLLIELDRSAAPDSVTKQFSVSNNADDVARVFYLPNTATVQSFYEVATTVRTITDTKLLCGYDSTRALAVRGTADQIAAIDWMIHELDQPAGAKRTDSTEYKMADTGSHPEPLVRVLYLPYTSTVQQFQEIATMVRTITETRRLFTYNAPNALVVRGTSDQMAAIAWLVHELGTPVTADRLVSPLYQMADDPHGENVVQVFYVKDAATVQAFQQLATQVRTTIKIRRVFTYNATMAMTLRGTADQIAAAGQMFKDRQMAAK
jgi:type II secretory pathway component GspD/PulD (secretin)